MEFVDFSNCPVSAKDCRLLKSSAQASVPKEQCERLLRYKLVAEEVRPIPGYFGERLETCRATDLGRDYLAWLSGEGKRRRRETVRYWITTAIAFAALVKAFLPEIAAAVAWLSTQLKPQ